MTTELLFRPDAYLRTARARVLAVGERGIEFDRTVFYPMGGGQGKSKGGGGRHHPVSPWGQLAKGFKTRSKHKPSDRFILERRRPKKKS